MYSESSPIMCFKLIELSKKGNNRGGKEKNDPGSPLQNNFIDPEKTCAFPGQININLLLEII